MPLIGAHDAGEGDEDGVGEGDDRVGEGDERGLGHSAIMTRSAELMLRWRIAGSRRYRRYCK